MLARVRAHLDPVGGIAGDMFAAAVLDVRPDLEPGLREALARVSLPESVKVEVLTHRDHALCGTRFRVRDDSASGHVRYAEVRTLLRNAPLATGPKRRALDIFALLADAEARVHGIGVEEVTFHEVGGYDSIADVVGAAFLIDALGADEWSTARLPLGSGHVRSAHGRLPVPAPATALLLEGFAVHDDGLEGERVTPTGAAIVRHLRPTYGAPSRPMRLAGTGTGFGRSEFPGISNVLRLLLFEEVRDGADAEQVAVVEFEVDDQPAEDLAVGLDRLRALAGVLDAVQAPVFGKKGRLATQVRALARPEALEPLIEACFAETTTLGVRWHLAERTALRRSGARAGGIRVKSVRRPTGVRTGKAEVDDVADAEGGFAERARLRREAEAAVLEDGDE